VRHDIQRRADRNGCVLFLLDDCRRRDSSILGEIIRCHVGVVERVDRVLEAANVATKTRHRTQRGDRSGDGRRGRRSGTRMRATTGRGDATQHDRCNRRSCPSRSHRQRLHPATLPVRAPRHGFFDPGCPFPPGAGIESDDPDGPPRERARGPLSAGRGCAGRAGRAGRRPRKLDSRHSAPSAPGSRRRSEVLRAASNRDYAVAISRKVRNSRGMSGPIGA